MSHALERYREHFPDADAADLDVAVQEAEPVSAELAQELTQRRGKPSTRDTYLLAQGGRGLFVLAQGRLVTYLRLSDAVLEVTARILEKTAPEPPVVVAATPPSPESLTTLRASATKRLRRYFNTGALSFAGMPDLFRRVEAMRTIVEGVVEDGDIDRVRFRGPRGEGVLEVRQMSAVVLAARWAA